MTARFDRKPVRIDPRTPWLEGARRFLSPMAGVTDRPFREVCRRYGADMGFCEFVSASGLMHGGRGSWKLVDTDGEEGLVGVQIFGSEPEHMAQAARLLAPHRMDVLDINFGCPVKKVVRKCGGSALLADVPLLERIVRAVLAESAAPVTAKIRTGWDEDTVNYREVGALLQDLGLPWVTMHGRTRAQLYKGEANWDRIADLVETLDIPVIGNGDVTDGDSYRRMVEHTRCHGVMVARGAIGNPWIFAEMQAVDEGRTFEPPTFAAMCEVIIEHIEGEVGAKGERTGSQTVRKHVARCFKGRPGAGLLRKRVFAEDTSEGMIAVIREAAARGEPDPAHDGEVCR